MDDCDITPYAKFKIIAPVGVSRHMDEISLWRGFWATVCKTVRPMLSDRCLSCVPCLSVCPVCDVGVLRSNSWMDQDETWRAGRPRPWPYCVRWGLSYIPAPKGEQPPNFRPISVVIKWLDGLRCHLVRKYASADATLC